MILRDCAKAAKEYSKIAARMKFRNASFKNRNFGPEEIFNVLSGKNFDGSEPDTLFKKRS